MGVPFLGVPIIRLIVFWGVYWGPPILGNYHVSIKIMVLGSFYNLNIWQMVLLVLQAAMVPVKKAFCTLCFGIVTSLMGCC